MSAPLLVVLCGCGGGGGSNNTPSPVLTTNHPPVTTAPTHTPNDASLAQYATYTFATTATDPDIGQTIASYEWDFGDLSAHKVTTLPTVQYAYTNPGPYTIQVRATDNLGLAGNYMPAALTVVAAPNPLTVTMIAPTAAGTRPVVVGSSLTVVYSINVANSGTGTLAASGIVLDPGDATATVAAPVNNGGGNWTITVTYPGASVVGDRVVTASVQVTDSNGARSAVSTFPAQTIHTVAVVDNPPVITLSSKPAVLAANNATWQGVPIVFSAGANDPDVGDVLNYTWTFGDSGGLGDIAATSDSAALTQNHTYAQPGNYSVTFTADDGRVGGKKSITLVMNILANSAPTLSVVQAPAGDPFANVPVTFTATAVDVNGDAVTFAWDFGDTGTATGAVATHSFQAAGVTTVTLTGNDGKGGITTWSAKLNVKTNRPPVATVTTPAAKLLTNKAYTFTANAVDPDAGDTIAQYQWDFNETPKVLYYSTTPTISHTFTSAQTGTRNVSVCAVDNHGSVGDFSPTVAFTVASSQPVVSFLYPNSVTTSQVTLGAGNSVLVSYLFTATNPNGPGAMTATLDPGEAGVTPVVPTLNANGSWFCQVAYPAAAAVGTRTINPKVTVTDASGVVSDPALPAVITIATVATPDTLPNLDFTPTPTVSAASMGATTWVGVPITFSATASDTDKDPLTYAWTFSDPNSTAANGDVARTPLAALGPVHTYSAAGTYPVTFSVSDGRSAARTLTRNVTILANQSPVFDPTTPITMPANVFAYQPVTFTANLVTPATGVTFTWNFDGAGTGTGQTATWTFLVLKPAVVTVTADDGKGGVTTATINFTVQFDLPPSAATLTSVKGHAGNTSTVAAGGTLFQNKVYDFTATATASTYPVASYVFDYGDGTVDGLGSHSYAPTVAGPVSVKVAAMDSKGVTGAFGPAVSYNISAAKPTITFLAPLGAQTSHVTLGNGNAVTVSYLFTVTNPNSAQPLAVSLDPGDAGLNPVSVVPDANGNYFCQVSYAAAGAVGSRLVTPKVGALDGIGVSATVTTPPAITIATVATANNLPNITVTPTAKVSAAPQGTTWVGVPITFTGTAVDPDNDPLTYAWAFGDPGSAAGNADVATTPIANLSPVHTYNTAGTYQATFTVSDGRAAARTLTRSIVILPNVAPVFAATPITMPAVVYAYMPVTFTANLTTPTTGVTFTWNFDNEGVGAGQTAVYTFLSLKPSTVTVTADDGRGGKASASITFNVLFDLPPSAASLTSVKGHAGDTSAVALGGALFQNKVYDFTATATATTFPIASYIYDYGDGTVDSLGSHAYASSVLSPVSVKVAAVDQQGVPGPFGSAVSFTLSAVKPVTSFLSPAGAQTSHVTLGAGNTVVVSYVVKATNPNGSGFLPIAALSLTPGNGSAATFSKDNGDGTYVFQFAYGPGAAVGSVVFNPTLVALDASGVASDPGASPAITIQTVAAANTPPEMTTIPAGTQFLSTPPDPTVVFTAPGTNATWAGVPITFAGVAILDPDGDPLTATWDFGDGTPTVSSYNNTVSIPNVSHAYAADGYYTVKLTVDDGRANGAKWLIATPGVTVFAHGGVQSIAIAAGAAPYYAWVPQAFTSTVLDKNGQPYAPALVRWDMGDLMPVFGSTNFLADTNLVSGLFSSLPLPWSSYSSQTLASGAEVLLNTLNSGISWSYPPRGLTQVTATAYDGMGGKATSNTLSFSVLNAPAPVATLVTPAGTFYLGNACVFTAAAVPSAGLVISSYVWDFGDGTPVLVTTLPTAIHTYTATGTMTVRVYAVDSAGTAGAFTTGTAFSILPSSPPIVTSLTPAGPVSADVLQGNTFTQVFTISVTNPQGGTGATIGASNITFNANDLLSSATVTATGGNTFSITVIYRPDTAKPGLRTNVPTVYATDSFGVKGPTASLPAVSINSIGIPPAITITTPASSPINAYMLTKVSLQFNLVNQAQLPTTYVVDWGDNSAKTTYVVDPAILAPLGLDLKNGVPIPIPGLPPGSQPDLLHAYTGPGSYVITVSATDTRTLYNTAIPRTTTVIALANAYPTASITSPQASGTLPTPVELPPNPVTGLANPPGANDPDMVVIPLNGTLLFKGSTTLTTSGEPLNGVQWSFQGGVPSIATTNPAAGITVMFPGVPGAITPYLVQFVATDAFFRVSNDPAANPNPKTYRKWVVVDGVHTQNFNLTFLYRRKADNNGVASLTPVVTAANGLNALVNIYQDGASYPFNVFSANQATVNIPVRSNLPFYLKIPSFNGNDPISYMLRIPNSATGADADPSLVSATWPTAPGASTFSFTGNGGTTDPALAIVTAQGFAAETAAADARRMQGGTDYTFDPTIIKNERWIDRLTVPNTDNTWAQWSQSNSTFNVFSGLAANQSFAEWPVMLETWTANYLSTDSPTTNPAVDQTSAAGKATDMGFNLSYSAFTPVGKLSLTYATKYMEAFRIPAGVTDPYDLTTGPANWNIAPVAVDLKPTEISVALPSISFFKNMIYAPVGNTPLAGGLDQFTVPFDPNDKDRKVIAPVTRSVNGVATFSYAEYLWSSVWARPLVLNSAEVCNDYLWGFNLGLGKFPYFRYSAPTAWPIYDHPAGAVAGIPESDGSLTTFNLTARGAGGFSGQAPLGFNGASAPNTGVGHFYWTGYTPTPDMDSGALITRTWLANDTTGLPPVTADFNASPTGDAVAAMGFLPPVNVVVDKRSRNAQGVAVSPESLGGYRVTWFNPTTDSTGAVVAPDFWVVEVDTGSKIHYLLPGGFPANQDLSNLILTDCRIYQTPGGAAHGAPAVAGDTLAPGYCWFDIVPELRPPTGGSANVTVFALKSILKNQPPGAAMPRPLNRTDWIDAIKTATATMSVTPASGFNLTYAHKIPFNYAWDIVVVNSGATPVAP